MTGNIGIGASAYMYMCGHVQYPLLSHNNSSMSIISESPDTVQCVRYVQYRWTLWREALIRKHSYIHNTAREVIIIHLICPHVQDGV